MIVIAYAQVAQFAAPTLAVCKNRWEMVRLGILGLENGGLRILGLTNGWEMISAEIPLI